MSNMAIPPNTPNAVHEARNNETMNEVPNKEIPNIDPLPELDPSSHKIYSDNVITSDRIFFDGLKLGFDFTKYAPTSLEYLLEQLAPQRRTFMLGRIMNIRSGHHASSKNKVHSKTSQRAQASDSPAEKSYDRLLSLMCLGSRAGRNAFMILIKSEVNGDALFNHNAGARDRPNENGFCPGAYVVIVNPFPVTKHFGDAEVGIPILDFIGTLYLVDKKRSTFVIHDTPQATIRNKYGCFLFMKCTINIVHMSIEKVPCRGTFCDAVDLVRDNRTGFSGCACFCAGDTDSRLLYRFKLSVTTSDGQEFESDYMSRRMTKRMTHNGFPIWTDLDTLYRERKEDDCWDQGIKYFNKGNELGGFTVGGWFRPGMIVDQGSNPNSKNNIMASTYLNHVTFIDFPQGWELLEDYRCDVSTLMGSKRGRLE